MAMLPLEVLIEELTRKPHDVATVGQRTSVMYQTMIDMPTRLELNEG